MENNKIKVCLLCQVSNSKLSGRLPLRLDLLSIIKSFSKHLPIHTSVADNAVWNTYAISEMEKHLGDIELHVVSPYSYLKCRMYDTVIGNTYYHFFRDESTGFFHRFWRRFFKTIPSYKRNRRIVGRIVSAINPDIIHLIGAENPEYASAIIDFSHSKPVFVQLQTLMNDIDFVNNYKLPEHVYAYRAAYEMAILRRADYIGTRALKYIDIIRNQIMLDKIILGTTLPLTEPINLDSVDKEYDFVYYASDISKSVDWAVESFILASERHPGITLDVIGGYSQDTRNELERKLKCYSLCDNVFFEGRLETHDDVIRQVRKSRFAVLPMKIDLITGTVRECMANGIPVVTNVTPFSPKLNEKRMSVLLSEKEDYKAMADNMCRLLEDAVFAETIRQNAGKTSSERITNAQVIDQWLEAYKAILGNYHDGAKIPIELIV